MKIHASLEQGSDEWIAIRKGKPTASRFSDIITPTGKLSASSVGYIRELIAECFCPDFQDWAGNKYTDRGQELEPEAREAFSKHTGLAIEQVGFVAAEGELFPCGCSPDSLVMVNGVPTEGVEIKCPGPKAHVNYVLDGVLPDIYKQQVHGSMAVTGLSQWHFWSHFPGMKPFHFIARRDDYTRKIESALAEFVARYKTTMAEAVPKLKLNPQNQC